jgi:hypothetical protein
MTNTTSTPSVADAPRRLLPPPRDDMEDTADDRRMWPALASMLDLCAEVIEPPFRKADQAALKHQRNHRQLIRFAASFGTVAVILAILQLAFDDVIGPSFKSVATAEEALAVIIALIAVGLGFWAAFQIQWLVERNKAERLRLAKFRFLIDPELWYGDAAALTRKRAELESKVQAIARLERDAVHHWLEADPVPQPPESVLALTEPASAGGQLLDYYRTRRLRYQLAFFQKRANENVTLQNITKHPSPLLFFGSVGVVLIHFVYDFVHDHIMTGEVLGTAAPLDSISRWLIVLAASMPVIGGGIRTFRSAYEFARNTYRYRAKAVALTSIDSALDHASGPRAEFLAMWYSEETLETEHREWLRLMIEAEWFA